MLELRDLTVGQVSGMIAAAVFVVQILIPITLPLILLGLIKLRSSTVTQTAVSWSVIGRLLHSSWWPVLLGTDSAQTMSAGGPPLFISLFRAFAVILIGVSAIVTPLGLYEGIVADAEPSTQLFHYIPDKSTMGLGTAPRTNITWSRICGGFGPYPCPNSNSNISYYRNLTGEYVSGDWYDSRVLPHTIDVLQSGLKNFESTVSGPFDIQYRMYQQQSINDNERAIPVDNLTAYTVGSYMPLSTLVMADDILVVEGLIVDMKNGGIGFRNHSAPAWRQFGSTWEEDILFIEPDTVCVDTNLTLTFIVPRFSSEASSGSSGVYKLTLVDEGGFVNLNQTYPAWTPGDTQTDPVLQFRAYKAAWLNNAFSMAFMNVTNFNNKTTGQKSFSYLNSTVGKKFPLYYPDGESGNSLSIKPNALQIGRFGGVVSGLDTGVSNISTIGNSTEEYNFPSKDPIYINPFGITDSNFSSASLVCEGAGGADLANITNQIAECGMLYGAPRRADGSDSMLFDPGSEWTISMYSCMSTVKATIKRVSFRFNGTSDDASSLKVVSLADKEYPNEESKPLWAAENTNMSLRDGGPLWGIVDPSRAQDLNLSTFRSERFYLPGYTALSGIGFENLPSIDFPRYALSQVYSPLGSTGVDYTGATNLAMYRQWRELSKEPGSAAKILNLMWTDIAANLVVGTKSLDPESQTSNGESNTNIKKRAEEGGNNQKGPAITGYERRVRYKLPYGIPAFLALAVTAFTVIPSIFFVFSSARPSQMKQVLNATSAGRLLTSGGGQTSGYDTSYGGQGQMVNRSYGGDASTKDWIQSVGKAPFTLGPEGWSKNMQPAQPGTPYATYGDGKNGPVANYAPVPGGQY